MNTIAMDINVAALVDLHEREVDRRTGVTSWLAGLSNKLTAMGGAWMLRVQARWMRDQAVWFQGAAAMIDAAPREGSIDPEWLLIKRLAAQEVRLNNLQGFFAGEAQRRAPDQALKAKAALVDLTCAIADLRGALQAHEADVCSVKLRRSSASRPAQSADELEEALHRLAA